MYGKKFVKKVNIFSVKSTYLLNAEVHSVKNSAVWKIEKFILTEKSFVKATIWWFL